MQAGAASASLPRGKDGDLEGWGENKKKACFKEFDFLLSFYSRLKL